jgi:hypothetical protein
MKPFFKKYKNEIMFWGISAALGIMLLFFLFFSFKFLINKIDAVTDRSLIKPPEAVSFNIAQLEKLLEEKKEKQ